MSATPDGIRLADARSALDLARRLVDVEARADAAISAAIESGMTVDELAVVLSLPREAAEQVASGDLSLSSFLNHALVHGSIEGGVAHAARNRARSDAIPQSHRGRMARQSFVDNRVGHPWWEAPIDEAPAMLPVTRVIASADETAIVLAGVRVFSSGLELLIERVSRRGDRDDEAWAHRTDVFMERPHTPFGPGGEESLRFAIRVDGSEEIKANDRFSPASDSRQQPEGPSLMRRRDGAHGSLWECVSRDRLWAWPLPLGEVLELVVRWPALDLPDARVQFEIGSLPELSERAQPLWM